MQTGKKILCLFVFFVLTLWHSSAWAQFDHICAGFKSAKQRALINDKMNELLDYAVASLNNQNIICTIDDIDFIVIETFNDQDRYGVKEKLMPRTLLLKGCKKQMTFINMRDPKDKNLNDWIKAPWELMTISN